MASDLADGPRWYAIESRDGPGLAYLNEFISARALKQKCLVWNLELSRGF